MEQKDARAIPAEIRKTLTDIETRLFDQVARSQNLQNAAIEASLKSIDTLRRAGMTAALLLTVFGGFVAFMGVGTFAEIETYGRNEILKAVAGQTTDSSAILQQIDTLKANYEAAVGEADTLLNDINSRRNELQFLTELDASTPTLNYFVLASELEEVHSEYESALNKWLSSNSDSTMPSIQRLLDDATRTKAAAIFTTLVSAAEIGPVEGSVGVSRDTLFNAAADAFRLDFNELGLRLVSAGRVIGGPNDSISAEHEARFLRAQLQLQQITVEEALSRVPNVLSASNSVNLHLVVSEVWNIGLQSGAPSRVAEQLIDDLARWDGTPTSYSFVTIGRLLGRSHRPSDWNRSRCFIRAAYHRWKDEPLSVQWEASSRETIEHAARELVIEDLSSDSAVLVDECLALQ